MRVQILLYGHDSYFYSTADKFQDKHAMILRFKNLTFLFAYLDDVSGIFNQLNDIGKKLFNFD